MEAESLRPNSPLGEWINDDDDNDHNVLKVSNSNGWQLLQLTFLSKLNATSPSFISYFVAYEAQKSKHNEHMVRENWEWDVHLASSVRATIFPFISFSLGVVANTN